MQKQISLNGINRKSKLVAMKAVSMALLSVIALPLISCSPRKDFSGKIWKNSQVLRHTHAWREIQNFAYEMDKVSREIEEWGTAGISAPIIVHNKDQFKFDPKVTAEDLYKENRIEGAVSLRTSSASNVDISIDLKKIIDNVVGNLAAMNATDDASMKLTLRNQIVGALRNLAGSTEGQAAMTALLAGRPELVGIVNAVTGVATGDMKGDSTAKAEEPGTTTSNTEEVMASTPAETLTNDTTSRVNAAATAVGAFSKMLGTYDGKDLIKIKPNRRIRHAASDNWELNLHKFFSVPENLVGDYIPVFVTFSVSCQPGWRTRSNFAGVVDVRVEYMYKNESGDLVPMSSFFNEDAMLPVAGIYPAYDSQELNLRSSQRELRTFAFQLASAGEVAAAKIFLEAANRREQDAETNTGLATVTGYSYGGQGFGYEFRPSFRALEQPGSLTTKPGFRLEPITFPAVAIALVDKKLLKKKIVELKVASMNREDSKKLCDDFKISSYEQADKNTKKLFDIEMLKLSTENSDLAKKSSADALNSCRLVFNQTHTWRPLNPPLASDVPLLNIVGRLIQPRLSEFDFANRFVSLGRAYEHFINTFCGETKEGAYNYNEGVLLNTGEHATMHGNRAACEGLRKRWAMLASLAVNFSFKYDLKLKDFDKPSPTLKITSVSPPLVEKGSVSVVVIKGKKFGKYDTSSKPKTFISLVKNIVIGGQPCNTPVINPTTITAVAINPTTIVATVPSGLPIGRHAVTVVTEDGQNTLAAAYTIIEKRSKIAKPAIIITRDSKGRVISITIDADAQGNNNSNDGKTLLKTIQDILKEENCCDNVKIDVKCTAKKSGT